MSRLLSVCVCVAAAAPAARAEDRVFLYQEPHMGCLFSLKLVCAEESRARLAKSAVFKRISELNAIMSDYAADSELNKLCANAGKDTATPVSDPLFAALQASERISKWSDGAYDITIGPCSRLWRESKRTQKLPDAAALERSIALVGWKNVRLEEKSKSVRLLKPGMQLDLGGIAKGYALDEAVRILRNDFKFDSFLLDAAGQVAAFGAPPGKSAWTLAIAPVTGPSAGDESDSEILQLTGWHLDTSGDAQQHVEIGGKRFSHILDPKTGLGLTTPIQASVIAKNGADADAIATAICVLGPEKGMKLMATIPGTEAMILKRLPDGQISRLATPGWNQFRLRN